jgi:hypothetical protein
MSEVKLIQNTIKAAESCRWCSARNEPHTPACPAGERYKQVQDLGRSGIPVPRSGNEFAGKWWE